MFPLLRLPIVAPGLRDDSASEAELPQRDARRTLLRNGVANGIRTITTGLLGVLLPIALAVIFNNANYAAWALVFGLATYVSFFDLGVPTSVQTLVAQHNAHGDAARSRATTWGGIRVTLYVSAAFLLAGIGAAFLFRRIAPDMPTALVGDASIALVILVAGQGARLVALAVSAYFAGLQRNLLITIISAPAQLLSAIAATILAIATGSLVLAALGFTIPLVLGTAVLMVAFATRTRVTDRATTTHRPWSLAAEREVLSYSGPIMLWSVCQFVVYGSGSLLVGHFAYGDVGGYSLAAVASTAITGVVSSLAAPLLPEMAGRHASGNAGLARIIVLATRVQSSLLYTVGGLVNCAMPLYFFITLGDSPVGTAWLSLLMLSAGAIVHGSATPLTYAFIATGRHTRLVLPPVAQAATTLIISVALVGTWGAVGVTLGVLVGAVLGTTLAATWSVRLSGMAAPSSRSLLQWTMWSPFVGYGATAAAAVFVWQLGLASSLLGISLAVAAAAANVAWQWLVVIPAAERTRIVHRLRRIVRPDKGISDGASVGWDEEAEKDTV